MQENMRHKLQQCYASQEGIREGNTPDIVTDLFVAEIDTPTPVSAQTTVTSAKTWSEIIEESKSAVVIIRVSEGQGFWFLL